MGQLDSNLQIPTVQFSTGTMRSDRPPNCLLPKSRIARSITLGSHDISVV
jgi:hypothetical protein